MNTSQCGPVQCAQPGSETAPTPEQLSSASLCAQATAPPQPAVGGELVSHKNDEVPHCDGGSLSSASAVRDNAEVVSTPPSVVATSQTTQSDMPRSQSDDVDEHQSGPVGTPLQMTHSQKAPSLDASIKNPVESDTGTEKVECSSQTKPAAVTEMEESPAPKKRRRTPRTEQEDSPLRRSSRVKTASSATLPEDDAANGNEASPTGLGENSLFCDYLANLQPTNEALICLHRCLYKTAGQKLQRKKNIKQWKGLRQSSQEELDRITVCLMKFTSSELRELAQALQVDTSDETKTINELVKALVTPQRQFPPESLTDNDSNKQ